ncbi:hypothetical protein BBK82_24715 [Lentzea guizhouensis]|uniref:Uncharacterized protein n=1 Tax=Lentzea guizhouensis TaxID=1586287 RepID=A0A1B2HM44_9PSEU|nr:hypothetical protein BBK82_24715 [Lentzea guizhouensis]
MLLVLGGVLAAVSTQLSTYTVLHRAQEVFAFGGTLWRTSAAPTTGRDLNPLLSVGTWVVITVVVMVVAGLLALRRDRVAPTARVVVLVAAAAFLGVVTAYAVGVLREEEMINAYEQASSVPYVYRLDPGLYLLFAAAVVGLAGAVLAQRPRPAVAEPDEDAVVVHQLVDDDTPPFGIAMPVAEEPRRD